LALLEFLAWAGMGLVVYSYALYPLVLSVVAAGVQLVRDARYVLAKRDRRGQASW